MKNGSSAVESKEARFEVTTDEGETLWLTAEEYAGLQAILGDSVQRNGAEMAISRQKFSAIEHAGIGNEAFHRFILKNWELLDNLQQQPPLLNANTLELSVNPRLRLSPGLLVALGGDFYGVADSPICGVPGDSTDAKEKRRERFVAAYKTLAETTGDKGLEEMRELREVIQGEGDAILEGLENGKTPKEALDRYSGLGLTRFGKKGSDYYYGMVSRKVRVPWMFFYSRYVDLAAMNFDHFGEDAKLAYEAGHAAALQTAKEAAWIKIEEIDSEETKQEKMKHRRELLVSAFTQELFACHFLTDLFASGHMRTPRRALVNYVSGLADEAELHAGKRAGLLAQAMHDEDNEHGLWVESDTYPWSEDPAQNKAWKAYGDHCYQTRENKDNKEKVIEVVQIALQSVYDMYRNPSQAPTFDPKRYFPKVIDPSKIAKLEDKGNGTFAERRNHQPLFKVEPSADDTLVSVSRRKSLTNLNDTRERKKGWHSVSTLAKVKLWHSGPGIFTNLDQKEKDDLRAFLMATKDEDRSEKDKPGSRCIIQ